MTLCPPPTPMPRSAVRPRGSIRGGVDHLPVRLGPERPVGLQADCAFQEANTPVAEREVGAAGVVAVGADEAALFWAVRGARVRGVGLAGRVGVLRITGRSDGIEQRGAHEPC